MVARPAPPLDTNPARPRTPPGAHPWPVIAAIFLLALVVRVAAAAAVAFPVPEDTAYYAAVARNFVEGHSLVSDSLWSYRTPPLVVPHPAFEIWMPLPTFLAAIPMWIAGASNWFRAAQVSSILTSAAIPVLAWRLMFEVASERRLPPRRVQLLALGSGVLCAIVGPLVTYGALPDSTAPFTLLSLTACLLMTRILAARSERMAISAHTDATTPVTGTLSANVKLLAALGVVFGLAILTRSEAVWLGLAWLLVAWFSAAGTRLARAGLIALPAAIAALIYLPWAIRDWQAFGTPLPSQSLANALYVNHMDIFAWADPPTLSHYLAQGPVEIARMHASGVLHNLVSVLMTQGFPIGFVGLLALALVWRQRTLRPLLVTALLTFAATSLLFPVSTLSGTYLHAAGATYVLLVVSCLLGLDAFIDAIGRLRHWTRPVAWLGPSAAVAVALPLSLLAVGSVAHSAADTEARYEQLRLAMSRAGLPLEYSGPIIANFPVWVAESARTTAIALPDEPPASVLDLARTFGSQLVVVDLPDASRKHWPALAGEQDGGNCFREVRLTDESGRTPVSGSALADFRVFQVTCP